MSTRATRDLMWGEDSGSYVFKHDFCGSEPASDGAARAFSFEADGCDYSLEGRDTG